MYVESVDFKRQSWESKILGDLLTRLIANGYQGLLAEVHQAAGRFSRPRSDRSLPASLGQADGFADVLIPPAQPHTRVIFFLAQPDLRRQPAFRGRPTALGSQLSTLLPDKPSDQAREAMERLVSSKIVERWHVVICRQGGQWLAVAPGLDEIKSFIGSSVACPHCGTRMGEEIQEVAYRLTEAADAQLADNRPLCELLDAALRRARADAVGIDPGRGGSDGAALYLGTALGFRGRPGPPP